MRLCRAIKRRSKAPQRADKRSLVRSLSVGYPIPASSREIKLVLPGGKIEGSARIHYRTPHKITDLKNITFLKSGSDFCVTDRVRSLAILRSARVLLSATIATDHDL